MTAASYALDGRRTDDKAEEKIKARNVTRVQLDLPPRSMQRLGVLKDKTESSSYAEVIRNALQLYEGLIEEVEGGKQFFIKDENGNLAPFKLFL